MGTSLTYRILLLAGIIVFSGNLVIAQGTGNRNKTAPVTKTAADLPKVSIDQYVELYAPLAKAEMRRVGIPASITLAQGILESKFGNSMLATKANNHFGIKCHKDWAGRGIYADDDAKNECFRVYNSVEDSYKDHSEFLRNRERYAFLFKLRSTDYKSWAKGLTRAGYATNPMYSSQLIRIIEERKLYRFDIADGSLLSEGKDEVLERFSKKIFIYNKAKIMIVQPGQTLLDIAELYQVDIRRLRSWNSVEDENDLDDGSKIYLQPKKGKGKDQYHTVRELDNMMIISQFQGIKLNALYKKNGMVYGDEPAVGERLHLWKSRKQPPRLKTPDEIKRDIKRRLEQKQVKLKQEVRKQKKVDEAAGKKTSYNDDSPSIADVISDPSKLKDVKDSEVVEGPINGKPDEKAPPVYHYVNPKETLFYISERYGTTPERLKQWNKLQANTVRPGQKLIVGYGKVKVYEDREIEMINEPNTKDGLQINDQDNGYHIVQPGEGLYSIARRHKITVEEIMRWNEMESSSVAVGQRLMVNKALAPDELKEEEKTENRIDEVKWGELEDKGTAVTKEEEQKEPEVVKEEIVKEDTEVEQPTKVATSVKYHTVAAGETLWAISSKYNVTVAKIKAWNSLSSNSLSKGQLIIVGDSNDESPVNPVVEEKETEVKKEEATPTYEIHTVQPQETLYAVSRKYNVPVDKIIEWNKLSSNSLNVGQQLKIFK